MQAFGTVWRVEPSVMPNHIKMFPVKELEIVTPIRVGDRFISEEVEYRIAAVCTEKVLIAQPLENPSRTK